MRDNKELVHVVVAEGSDIIRSGITTLLRRSTDPRINVTEVASLGALDDVMQARTPGLLIVSPAFEGHFDIQRFRIMYRDSTVKVWAVVSSIIDHKYLRGYDATIGIFDTAEAIIQRLHETFVQNEEENEDGENLSQREREVLVGVVKGMTNKEIADNLYLSIHTVITHRRNIARKLQVHSISGLTIYAIVNKLVDIDDIKT